MSNNTRVKDIKEKLRDETDPDIIAILEFDLAEAMGKKDAKSPVKRSMGSPRTGEVASSGVRGAGAAIKGTNFKGVF